jgi:hypothetical protein
MAQQLLNRLHIFAIHLYQSAERVSQRMPPHVARNLCRFERRLEMGAKKRPRPIRLFALLVWSGKHPIARLGIGSLELPIQQDLGQFRVERRGRRIRAQAANEGEEKMFGNESCDRTLKGSERCRTMTALQEAWRRDLFSSWPFKLIILAGELTKSASLPKHSFVDFCLLIERARLRLIGPGAIIRGVFRHPHAEDSSLPF